MKFCRTLIEILLLVITCLIFVSACDSSPVDDLSLSPNYQRTVADYIPESELKLRHSTISNIHYDLNLDLTQASRYAGTIDIRFNYLTSRYPVTVDFAGGEVERVWLNNSIIGIDYNGEFLTIPPQIMRSGNNRIRIQFSRPYSHDAVGLNRFLDPKDQGVYLYLNSAVQASHHFMPMFDQPELPFSIKAILSTDKDWKLYSSLLTTKSESRGDFTLWYTEAEQMHADDIALLVGTWHEWQGRNANKEVKVLVRKSLKDQIPVRSWYQRIQSVSRDIATYFQLDTEEPALSIALLPGLYGYKKSTANLLSMSEQPLLFNSDLSPKWYRLLSQHYVAMSMQAKSYNDRWPEYWLTQQVMNRLFNQSYIHQSKHTFANRVQPSQRLVPNNYQATMDNLNNENLLAVKAPLVLNGLWSFSDHQSLDDSIQSYLLNREENFSDMLDNISTTDSLSAVNWASKSLASTGYSQLTTKRVCAEGFIKQLIIEQKSVPNYPMTRHLQFTVEYLYRNALITKTVTMTSDKLVFDDFETIVCDAVVLINAEPAIDVRTNNQSAALRVISQAFPDKSLYDLYHTALRSITSLDENEHIEWLHLIRARLDSLSTSESKAIIALADKQVTAQSTLSDELATAYQRLSERLYQMSLQPTALPDERILWFKLHLATITDEQQANRMFNWFIGKAEPTDLNEIESLQIAVLNKLWKVSHQHAHLLVDYYMENDNQLFISHVSALELIYGTDYDPMSYITELLDNPLLNAADYAMVLFHEDFFNRTETVALLTFILVNLEQIEQRIGPNLLQSWLEPTLNNYCEDQVLSSYYLSLFEETNLARKTRVWLEEIDKSCQTKQLYQLN